ncbi:MAG TPA: DUF4198 domain-containing protein [Thermoanaerobaculia bacterium]|jgi:uncharacterized GH25 family protein|nr:DUF4198 domain-containing protein [Thermoanaerobaculia bacterium]
MPTLKPLGLSLLVLALSAPAAWGHDFWIEPSAFTPAPGQRVAVRLRVGQALRGDPVPRDPALLRRFAVVGRSGESPVPGVPNTDPAGFTAFQDPGPYTIVYESGRSSVELDAQKFEKYLGEEGLETVSTLRAGRGQSGSGVKEVFSRFAKALILTGNDRGPGYDQVLGQRLELVAETNPYALTGGGELRVRLLHEGKPLAGALIAALQKGRPEARISVRSDKQGRARLRLDRPGFWLVKAVHMVPASRETGADWESFWASLTFEVPGR